MRIVVNTRLLIKDSLEGIGWFTYETLKRITQNHPEHTFYFIFDRKFDSSFIFSDNIIPIVGYPQARHPYLWYMFFEWGIPYQLRKIDADLFLSTDGWIPLHLNIPVVNVIHDLNFERHPEFIAPMALKYYKKYFHQFAAKSTRIATVSEYSKKDIHELYHIEEDKIDVVYNGINEVFHPLETQEINHVREEYSQSSPYFLFVGLIHKRKNLDNIFRAFDIFKENDTRNIKLVIVGERKYWNGDIKDAYMEMKQKENVIFLGRVGAKKLSQLMGAAECLLYPSLYEGFGIPIVEAFQAEIPVMTSNVTSMPEVAGNAAYYVNPYSVDEIVVGMKKLSENTSLREELIALGKLQRQNFGWDITAAKLWESITNAVKKV